MKPLIFVRALYCVDEQAQAAARQGARERLGCPDEQAARSGASNPALFRATGYAHHPYELLTAPSVKPARPRTT